MNESLSITVITKLTTPNAGNQAWEVSKKRFGMVGALESGNYILYTTTGLSQLLL